MASYDNRRSMEQIAAGLAHEAKNPLALIRVNIDLLQDEDRESKHNKNYSIVRRELDKINDLLLDFIQFAKPMDNLLENVDIMEIFEKLISDLKISYNKPMSISLTTSCMPEERFVICDKSKIERVFFNLIKNSVEAIDDNGKIKINVGVKSNYLKITIEDNGKGMTEEELEKISSPFYTTKKGGSGLGLFMSRTIIGEHNGLFEITGKENEGCKVLIMLPSAK